MQATIVVRAAEAIPAGVAEFRVIFDECDDDVTIVGRESVEAGPVARCLLRSGTEGGADLFVQRAPRIDSMRLRPMLHPTHAIPRRHFRAVRRVHCHVNAQIPVRTSAQSVNTFQDTS
ncbi:MAG: hypothetical protein V4813_19255 [Gemmatimonadota bacterium]